MTHLMLIAAAFIWGINPMIMKIGLATIDPLRYNTLRLLLAFLVSLIFVLLGRRWKPVAKEDRKRFIAVGLGGFLSSRVATPLVYTIRRQAFRQLSSPCFLFSLPSSPL